MSKAERIMELVNELKELCPRLEYTVLDDMEDPTYLLMADEESFAGFASLMLDNGLESVEDAYGNDLYEELVEAIEGSHPTLIRYDDDDEDKGPLQ